MRIHTPCVSNRQGQPFQVSLAHHVFGEVPLQTDLHERPSLLSCAADAEIQR